MEATTEYFANFTEKANFTNEYDFSSFVLRLEGITINVMRIILIFGVVFNTLALLVLVKTKELRGKSMGKLLIALSTADNYVMLGKKLSASCP